jgi:ATP-dependent Lhr-like helicase
MPRSPAKSSTLPGMKSFHAATQSWFGDALETPTRIQREAWPVLAAGKSALLLAPTGSGKTLAAFLAAIDRLMFHQLPESSASSKPAAGVRILYISPLKALAVDVDRNLRTPLVGIQAVAERQGYEFTTPKVAVRSGDTSAADRRDIFRHPPEILITTPESLYLILTSKARDILRDVETVIIDEIHAVAATKRGVHLFLTLERLERLRREQDAQRPTLQRRNRPPPRRRRGRCQGRCAGAAARGRDHRRQRAKAARPPHRDASRRHGAAQPTAGNSNRASLRRAVVCVDLAHHPPAPGGIDS